MNSFERKLLEKIDKMWPCIVLVGATLLATAIRISLFPMVSFDLRISLLPWYEEIAVNGLYAQVGNYNLVYQLLIWFMTKLPIPAIYAYKILSAIFDYSLAAAAALLVKKLATEDKNWKAIWTYVVVLFCPIVFLNSSAWAQCDAIYASFALFGLYFMLDERYNLSLLSLGMAFVFKLHAVFILPVYLFVYFVRRKFSIVRFLIIPLTMVVTALPLLFWDRSLFDLVKIYLEQTGTYHAMGVNYPTVWAILCDPIEPLNFRYLAVSAVLLTVGILAVIMVRWVRAAYSTNGKNLVIMAFILCYTCVLFLPAMHERYGFIYEMCAIVLAVLLPKTIPLCIGLMLLSMSTYGYFLFEIPVNYYLLAWVNVALYTAYFFLLRTELEKSKE